MEREIGTDLPAPPRAALSAPGEMQALMQVWSRARAKTLWEAKNDSRSAHVLQCQSFMLENSKSLL